MISTYYFQFFTVFSTLCMIDAQFNETNECRCGRADDNSFRIVGGKEANPNNYPWMAAIYYKPLEKFFCGGALINDRYVVTAGHCVKWATKEMLGIVLGLHDELLYEEKGKDGMLVNIENILLHENFKNIRFFEIYDIALIRLSQKIIFNKKIKPVCLPKNPDEDYTGKTVQVTGWGKTKYKTGEPSRYLKEANVSVISRKDCQNHKIVGRYILDSMLCAYADKSDACQGDSGGPLTYESVSGRVELIGVVSWGIECAKPNVPGIYTRITSNLGWISKNTKDSVYCRNS